MAAEKQAVAFEVDVKDGREKNRKRKMPSRLQEKRTKTVYTKEQIDNKLLLAAERKKSREDERLSRIQAREEECRKLNDNVQTLLEQDAKRSGKAGTEHIAHMSKQDAIKTIKNVAKGFDSMSTNIVRDFKEAK